MKGPELYAIYQQAMLDEGVEVDEFEHLDDSEKAAWNLTADSVRPG